MALEITKIQDVGDDILLITAADGDQEYTATGWVSATRNHYRDGDYLTDPAEIDTHPELANADGDSNAFQLNPGAKSRKMTKVEVHAYALQRIREQNPDAGRPKPKTVTFTPG